MRQNGIPSHLRQRTRLFYDMWWSAQDGVQVENIHLLEVMLFAAQFDP